jgi:putative hydrolase of HD superfamily
MERLDRQIRFLVEIDKLKTILRHTYVIGANRHENTAEHSWQLAVMAILLAEHANQPIDLLRVLKMVLIHDIVEIDAGDTFVYDTSAMVGKAEREQLAAERLFGMLPEDQAAEFHSIWNEFEARETPEARFAYALDRLDPQIHNYHTNGGSWREHGISRDRVVERNRKMSDGASALWEWTQRLLDDAITKGFLKL